MKNIHSPNNKTKGFTLIELLIVIGIIAVLAAFSFVALNPLARFADSRNARRWADVNAILSAIKLDQVDNKGVYQENIQAITDDIYYQIGRAQTGCDMPCYFNSTVTLESSCVDIFSLVDEGYIARIPIEPNIEGASEDMTGYYLYKYSSGQICIGACAEEKGTADEPPKIEVCR